MELNRRFGVVTELKEVRIVNQHLNKEIKEPRWAYSNSEISEDRGLIFNIHDFVEFANDANEYIESKYRENKD